jgi:hypothetical protein
MSVSERVGAATNVHLRARPRKRLRPRIRRAGDEEARLTDALGGDELRGQPGVGLHVGASLVAIEVSTGV